MDGNTRCRWSQSSRFQVYEAQTLPWLPAIKFASRKMDLRADGKHRLNNGAVYQVKGFTKTGDLKLTNGWIIGKDYGNLAHGYCQTSHVAQSKTVDRVFRRAIGGVFRCVISRAILRLRQPRQRSRYGLYRRQGAIGRNHPIQRRAHDRP